MKTRTRLIAPEFWESDSVNDLTIRQRLLFLGLISNADDQGRLKGRAEYIKSKIFIYDQFTPDEIQSDLEAIANIQGIILYEASGRKYIQVIKWWCFQHPTWSQRSELPPPDGWADRWHYRVGNKVASYNWPETPDADPERAAGGLTMTSQRPRDGLTTKLPDNMNSNMNLNFNLNENRNEIDPGADAPKVEKPDPLTIGQRGFLDLFGAKRFKTVAARDAVLELEQAHGTEKLLAAGRWAAENQMSVGKAVGAVRTALPKWGKPKIPKGQKDGDPAIFDGIREWVGEEGVI